MRRTRNSWRLIWYQTFLVKIMKPWYEDKKAKVVQFYFETKSVTLTQRKLRKPFKVMKPQS